MKLDLKSYNCYSTSFGQGWAAGRGMRTRLALTSRSCDVPTNDYSTERTSKHQYTNKTTTKTSNTSCFPCLIPKQ